MQWFSMLTVHSNHMGIFKKVLMLEFFLQIKQSLRAGLGISNLKKFPSDSKALQMLLMTDPEVSTMKILQVVKPNKKNSLFTNGN